VRVGEIVDEERYSIPAVPQKENGVSKRRIRKRLKEVK